MQITEQQWVDVQQTLRSKVGESDFKSWLATLNLDTNSPDTASVNLTAPTRFIRDFIDKNYGRAIRETFALTLNKAVDVSFVVKPILDPTPPKPKAAAVDAFNKLSMPLATNGVVSAPDVLEGSPLNRLYRFDTFITGQSNEFAFAAAKRIAESDTPVFNPFFLYGGVGLGKTHLMHAIGWSIKEAKPDRKVLYISAEKFLFRFINAIRNKSIMSFKEAFRAVDVLMIDDIQFIAGKESTQEEFFHTFNALVEMGKQVILTADRPPQKLDNIEERLKSRLGCGLTCEMHAPDFETRLAILQKKAASMKVNLPADVATLLADKIASNVRELEGALNRLVAHADFVAKPITVSFALEQLRDILAAGIKKVSVDDIQKAVTDHYRLQISDMHAARRLRSVARPRQVAMYLCKQLTTKSFPDIGRSFGGRDHTTVIHAVRTIEDLMAKDAQLAGDVRTLERTLTGR